MSLDEHREASQRRKGGSLEMALDWMAEHECQLTVEKSGDDAVVITLDLKPNSIREGPRRGRRIISTELLNTVNWPVLSDHLQDLIERADKSIQKGANHESKDETEAAEGQDKEGVASQTVAQKQAEDGEATRGKGTSATQER